MILTIKWCGAAPPGSYVDIGDVLEDSTQNHDLALQRTDQKNKKLDGKFSFWGQVPGLNDGFKEVPWYEWFVPIAAIVDGVISATSRFGYTVTIEIIDFRMVQIWLLLARRVYS